MDGRIDEIREALDRLSGFTYHAADSQDADDIKTVCAALSTIDPEDNALKVGRHFCAQMPCSPTDCTEVPCRYMKDAVANRNNRDPEAIRREFWDDLHTEAKTQYDRRLELLDPIETLDDAAFRKTLADGWSAWLLAKRIIENRKAREFNL